MSGGSATELRARLAHPVIDIDGHTVEFFPALVPELAKEGVRVDGPELQRRMAGTFGPPADWYASTPAERLARRVGRGPWGGGGSRNEVDLATAMLPRLLYERLDELGIDVSVIYPSYGLLFADFEAEQDRRGACRALNRYNAALFDGLTDRLIPVAEIPMHTPEEAVDELDHAAGLGFKAVVMASFVARPVEAVARLDRDLGAVRGLGRLLRPRQRPRLRPRVGALSRPRHLARVPLVGDGMAEPPDAVELRLQPHRHAR